MAYTPVEIPRFGGLNLQSDPQELGNLGAVDLMDVMLDEPGRLRTRDGISVYAPGATATSDTPLALTFAKTPSPAVYGLVAQNTGDLNVQRNGFTTATVAGAGTSAGWFAVVGTPTQSYLCFTTRGAAKIWQGTAAGVLTTSAGGGPLAVTPWDNRLVSVTSDSRVRFSDPGVPGTFGANNYVDLTPGDGETIQEACVWGNLLFVFKQSKFFVFNGVSLDGSGNPIFNYRSVVGGHGVRDPGGAAILPEGVYFVDEAGLWVTTGGQPRKVSAAVDPLFSCFQRPLLSTLPYTSDQLCGLMSNATALQLASANNYLLIRTRTIVGSGYPATLAFHVPTQTWTAFSIRAAAMCGAPPLPMFNFSAAGDKPEDIFFYEDVGGTNLSRLTASQTVDLSGPPVVARYRTGFWSPGQPGSEAVVREILVDGGGTVTLKSSVNDGVALSSGAAVTLGAFPAVAQGRDRRALRGRDISIELSGAGPWSVSRLIVNAHGQDAPGSKAA
jgi:hypothetical protein